MPNLLDVILYHRIRKLVKNAYLNGLEVGFTTGFHSGQSSAKNKGVVLSSRVEEQVSQIMQSEQF